MLTGQCSTGELHHAIAPRRTVAPRACRRLPALAALVVSSSVQAADIVFVLDFQSGNFVQWVRHHVCSAKGASTLASRVVQAFPDKLTQGGQGTFRFVCRS